ncbi:VgrG-related protein [Streptomyces olivoreticuli]|uniref:VgrG-related protein n=1 Tax=Streptomyces olivoreticuli TaxID=68246 RepID=UPI002657B248|nr:VgrG-related protein [Streptomyces olivoreticuli]WKK24347.1 VgrG-related protein [Streptomyces olivoreticuli]
MAERHTAGLSVWVDGRRLPPTFDTALAWASVAENSRTSAAAEIGFRDPYRAAFLAGSGIGLGSALKLVAVTSEGSHDLFEGEVMDCEARAAHTGVFTVIRAEDHAHRLRRGTRTRAWESMPAGRIAEEIAKLAGLRTGEIDSTSVTYEFLTQPAMSDWDFLTHLARENGCDVFVRAGELHFKKAASASDAPAKGTPARQSPFALEFGQNLLKVTSAATLRHQVTGVSVRGWDPERKEELVADRTPTTTPARDTAWQADARAVRGEPLLLPGLPRSTQYEVEQVADAMAQEIAAGLTELRAVVRGEPRLRLRSAVSVTGLGKRFEGCYTVTSVRHEFHPDDGYLTELTVNEGADRTAGGRPGDHEAGLRRFFGLHTGKVVNTQDPTKQGRVRVSLPWLAPEQPEGDKQAYVSTWARTVQPGGSKGHGVVLPEQGDEVLVGFEQGSLDRPYVIGGLGNGVDKLAPHSLDLHDSTGIGNRRSFASKEGHRLELLDAGAKGMGATLVTGDGKLQIQLDQHSTLVSIQSDGTVEITAGQGITLNAGQAPLELRGKTIDLSATGGIKVSGAKVELAATTDMQVSANGAVKVKGGALTEISATLVKIN